MNQFITNRYRKFSVPHYSANRCNTFKSAQVNYYGKSERFGEGNAKRNYPANIGRAKELAVGSYYQTYIIAEKELEIPHWIRLGKWAAKVRVEAQIIPASGIQSKSGEYICQHPLNPIDLPPTSRLLLYNRIVMPPVSLVSQLNLSTIIKNLPLVYPV